MNIKKYLTLTRAGILDELQFRAGLVVTFAGNLIYLVIIYFLWKAIYASAGTEVVNGMTFSDTMIYLVLASALFYFMEMYLVWEISRDIESGKIILNIIKPIGFRRYLFFSHTGNWIIGFFTTFFPTAIIVYFATNGAIHLGLNLIYFSVSVLMALLINFYIDFFVGTICLYTQSTWGINIMKEVIISLLSGASIPIAFFPESFATVVMFLPFQAIYNTPLRLLIQWNMNTTPRLELLGIQLFWVLFLMIGTKVFWNHSLRQITVNGG